MDLSIVIVNYNTFEYLNNCLKSLIKYTTNIDYDIIVVDNNSTERDIEGLLELFPQVKLVLNHENEVKGSVFGLNALINLKSKYHNLNVDLFSAFKKSSCVPDWVNYYYRPSQEKLCELYNSSAIFISPSLFEGFPLPPAESMMCGCALIATDIGGHQEYCFDNETAFIVPIKNSDEIFRKVELCIKNNKKRISVAKNGNTFIKKFNWEESVSKFYSFINNLE